MVARLPGQDSHEPGHERPAIVPALGGGTRQVDNAAAVPQVRATQLHHAEGRQRPRFPTGGEGLFRDFVERTQGNFLRVVDQDGQFAETFQHTVQAGLQRVG